MTAFLAAASPVAGAVLAEALLILTPAWIALTAPTHRRRRKNR